jgi:hypothetical protein
MRDFRDAKAMARALRGCANSAGIASATPVREKFPCQILCPQELP